MLNLFDYLTEEDNSKIRRFVCTYGVREDEYIGNKEYLKHWAENKKKLFHLLGGNLIYKIENIEIEKSEDILDEELNRAIVSGAHSFLWQLKCTLSSLGTMSNKEMDDLIESVFSTQTLVKNRVSKTFKFKLDNKPKMLQISEGMKPMKALKQILDYFDADEWLLGKYESMRIAHSQILNDKTIKGTLCFSIHPLDFMTASVKANGWTSCMDWTDRGCHRAGTVEMMNSNNVICAYMEMDKPFYYGTDDTECWNRKKWRTFVVCTKDIILTGKNYPYQSYDLSKKVVQELRELAKKNWHHTYQFGVEEYMDMAHIGSYSRMEKNREWIQFGHAIKHNIIIDTKLMYNDFYNDHDLDFTKYFCVRNKVKHNIVLSISGKAICPACGKSIVYKDQSAWEYGDEDMYNCIYSDAEKLLCEEDWDLDPVDPWI